MKKGTPSSISFLESSTLLYSNTLLLEQDMHWSGVLIEASPFTYRRLVKNRPNITTINAAICNETKEVTFLHYSIPCCRGIMEFFPAERRGKLAAAVNQTGKTAAISCVSLSSVLSLLQVTHINLLFLDVEGAEISVLSSINFSEVSFDVICVEKNEKYVESYLKILRPQGYELEMSNTSRQKKRNLWFVRKGFKKHEISRL